MKIKSKFFGVLSLGVFSVLLLTSGVVTAESYSLWNPTPDDKLRDLATDRPDKTESPITVDAGRFQIEADILT